MNKTLLLVTCDFLLLSMLALARFDLPATATVEEVVADVGPNPSKSEAELIRLLEDSLEFELAARSQIEAALAQTKSQLQKSSLDLAKSEQVLSSAQRKLVQKAAAIAELQTAESESKIKNAQLLEKNTRLVAERDKLVGESATTRTLLEDSQLARIQLMEEVGQSRLETAQIKARIQQADQLLAQRELQLKRALSEKESLVQQRETLDQKLQVALVERRLYAESMQAAEGEQSRLRAHVERLSQNPSLDERMRQAEKALTIREVELQQRERELEQATEQAKQQRKKSQQLSRQLELVSAERTFRRAFGQRTIGKSQSARTCESAIGKSLTV